MGIYDHVGSRPFHYRFVSSVLEMIRWVVWDMNNCSNDEVIIDDAQRFS